ncbi:hypothetical protein BGY98DRAFT_1188012 [Russula aff. rugulosa BPL654]|nr:hypothetical protein BGY98DRAFT_1188012 [Russula aff. rugulosa BPL654]
MDLQRGNLVPRPPSLYIMWRHPSLHEHSYHPMGSCGSTATVSSVPQPASPGLVTERTMDASVPLPPIAQKSPALSSFQTQPRPRRRTMSSTRPGGKSPQDPIPRSVGLNRESGIEETVVPILDQRPQKQITQSTVKQVLTNNPQFRILVVGKRGSGKSSLINSTFRVGMLAAPERGSDINLAFRPDNNRGLIVHEYSGLEPGDASGLQTIQGFITNRTDPTCAPAERLHAIWICIPTSDAVDGSIGEGLDEILSMRRVPVVVAFTKSDLAYPDISGSEDGNHQYQDRTRTRAYAQCEELCCSLFSREARDVPAELVSVMPQYGALINNLIVTTDRFIMGSHTTPSLSSSQGTKPRIAPTPLAWSVALRASRDITIQASIEIGRSREYIDPTEERTLVNCIPLEYWRNLWSSHDFAEQPLKSCVNIIHIDIIKIWNLYDRRRYLSSNQFKINMSHVVKDLATPAGGAPPSDWNISEDKFADWVEDVYRGSQENVRCVMGYIVNITVILDAIFGTTGGNVTENATLKAMGTHVRSGRRDSIHGDIRSFVTETFSIRSQSRKKIWS